MDNTLRKAAEMALDALVSDPYQMVVRDDGHMEFKTEKAIEALRQALAQPEQDEGVDGSVRIYIKRNGTFERVDTVEKALELSREMHTAPPKRNWVGLTEEERDKIIIGRQQRWEIAHMIEAALRSKNT